MNRTCNVSLRALTYTFDNIAKTFYARPTVPSWDMLPFASHATVVQSPSFSAIVSGVLNCYRVSSALTPIPC